MTTVIASGKGGDSILKIVAGQLVGTMFCKQASEALWEAHQRASRHAWARCSPSALHTAWSQLAGWLAG